jgi:hypothetical protein
MARSLQSAASAVSIKGAANISFKADGFAAA